MRFLYFTDPHFRETPPSSRIDDFYNVQFAKLYQIWQLKEKHKVDMILCGGDLFDKYSPLKNSFKFLNELIGMLKYPVYSIIGTHDIQGRNIDGLYLSALGTCELIKKIIIINGEFRVPSTDIIIKGIAYSDKFDEKQYIFGKDCDKLFKIIITHNTIISSEHEVNYPAIYAQEIETDADLVLCGHIHKPWYYKNKNGTIFANPGALVRQASDEVDNVPSVYIFDIIDRQIERFDIITIKHEKNVFNTQKTLKNIDKNYDSFVKSIKSLSYLNIEDYINTSAAKMKVPEDILTLVKEKFKQVKETIK